MNSLETIVAVATPAGKGGIGVLRISGERVRAIALEILGELPPPRLACLRSFRDSRSVPLDQGIALFFPAPHSFTGEDVLEFHGHAGPVLLDLLMARVLELGARLALPGEFSQRAFLNDKLDLTQAEAIADLIESGSEQAARAAMRSLQGEFATRAQDITRRLVETRMYVEAAIDFPEEEVDFLGAQELRCRVDELMALVADTLASAHQGALLREGMTVVIAGEPNAGKSSLLNALAGYEAAIVTAIPGTTRDVLRERIAIDGMPLHVIDTAGLRETFDIVETEGIRRAHVEMSKADRILFVIDASIPYVRDEVQRQLAALPSTVGVTLVFNKTDRTDTAISYPDGMKLSALTGDGLPELRQHLKDCMGLQDSAAGAFSARRRHLDALRRAQSRIATAQRLLRERKSGELMAEELRLAQQDIGEITGTFTSEDLLGRIFSSFCIGK